MARIRSVHPDICESETLANCSASAERTFVRIWTYCDDGGRCKAHPKLLKSNLYPMHDDMTTDRIDEDIAELEAKGAVHTYVVDGARYLQVDEDSWTQYQHPAKPTPSKLPPRPSLASTERSLKSTEDSVGATGTHSILPVVDVDVDVDGGVDGGGAGEDGTRCEPDRPPPKPPPPPGGHPKSSRKTQISEGFAPDAAIRGWAARERPSLDLAAEAAKFVDYHRAKGNTFADHQLAFRSWLRRIPPNGNGTANGHAGRLSTAEKLGLPKEHPR